MEFKDLKRLTTEFEGWIYTAKLLIEEVTGEDYADEENPNKTNKGKDEGSTTTDTDVAVSVEVRVYIIILEIKQCGFRLYLKHYYRIIVDTLGHIFFHRVCADNI
jgi:hypothetical protein